MSTDLKSSIVAVLDSQDQIVGTGFIVAENLLLTCAHVVRQAGSEPGGAISIRFAVNGLKQAACVDTQAWSPAEEADIALLRIESIPSNAKTLSLGVPFHSTNHPFYSFGYARVGDIQGVGARGTIVDVVDDGRQLQITSQELDRGFSGSPIVDETRNVVVGMVTWGKISTTTQRHRDTTFAVTSEVIQKICHELEFLDVCPYRSLDAFTEEDALFFFGRERVVTKLLDSLKHEPRFLAVLGPSGSGKSSVVRAGLIPALLQGKVPGSQKWGIVTIRPANNPFEQLAGTGFINPQDGLENAVKIWLANCPDKDRLVLVIDQFEEVLVSTPENIREKFISELAQLLDAPVTITVVLTLRDDFYSRFLQNAAILAGWLELGLVNIPSVLEYEDLMAMIVEPAKSVGLIFEEGLVDVIIADACETDRTKGVARSTILPLLEFALTQLWELREDGRVTHKNYHFIGAVSGGLSRWADKAYYSLNNDERKTARQVLTNLINFGDESQGIHNTKRIGIYNEIVIDDSVNSVMQKLIQARLLVTSYDNTLKQDKVEIIHEALFQKWALLSKWILEDRDYLRTYQQLIESAKEWEQASFDAGLLYRGARLAQSIQWLEIHPSRLLNKLEKDFLDASIKQQKIEIQIEKSLSAQGTILEAITDGVLVADPTNQVTFINQSIELIFSLSKDQLMGQRLGSLIGLYGENTNAVIETIGGWSLSPDSYKTGHHYSEQLTLDNGKIVLVSMSPVIWQNEFLGTVSNFRDITHEVEVDRLKSEFVATVSHELRTPMTSIRGYVDILLMGAVGALNENQTHFMSIIKNNTERLNILVNDLLDISRIEAGRVTLAPQSLDLRDVAKDVLADLLRRSQEDNKPMAFALDAAKNLPCVQGDEERIRQVMGNLVSNAYHYTPENGQITVRMTITDSNEIQVDVLDTGIGIPVEDQGRIFDRFYRGEDPLVLATPGTGLGLSIVKQLVEMHNGRIWLKSEGAGKGSIFSFTLPVYKKGE